MEPYVGIAVFELASESSEHSNFFREDFFLVYAGSDEGLNDKMCCFPACRGKRHFVLVDCVV